MRNLYLIALMLLFALSAGAQTRSKKDSAAANPPMLSNLGPEVHLKSISVDDAAANVGQDVSVGGKVFGHKNTTGALLLYLGADSPDQKLTVELTGRMMVAIKPDDIDGNVVMAFGRIKMVAGKPQITMDTGFMVLGKPRK